MAHGRNARTLSGLCAAAMLAGAAFVAEPFMPAGSTASAQGLFGGVAGTDCGALQQAGGSFWQGFYRGREESPFLSDDGLYEVTHRRCFQTRAECDGWLYDLQSHYVTTSRTWCRQYG
jgi:hypothetical protein